MNINTPPETQGVVGQPSYTPNALASRLHHVATFLAAEDMPRAAKELTDIASVLHAWEWAASMQRRVNAATRAMQAAQPSASPDLIAVQEALGEAKGRIAELEAQLQARPKADRDALWLLFCTNYKGVVTSKHAIAFSVVMDELGVPKARKHP